MEECLFCRIIKKEIPSNIVYESDRLVVFPDIHPSADLHYLIVPKEHIGGIGEIREVHGLLLVEINEIVSRLVKEHNLTDDFYRVVVNGGRAQHIPHIHFHLLGGQWKKMV